MGICCSCHPTSVVTGKLILPDGSLQEFSYPVKVSDVLRKNPSTFICNSDDMDFDNVVSPIKDDDKLQPGQLYFALPLHRLKRPLQPEEMAALAVKASAALAKCGGRGRRRSKNVCFMSSSQNKVTDVYTIGLSKRSRGGGGGKRPNFKAMLSAIPE
ncbi:hypothetical protein L1987_68345 [Smallanthus sonchifolius]|uniref:Uncharacterized protein n=1 Tax=Smallanthus sonchifolius TaxID=185202 RepID=A0ACB9B3P0_9ASTR|nr:hypothetical protein L1987_68345 [Smallanthus sonchifolius]